MSQSYYEGGAPYGTPQPPRRSSGTAVASLIFGILGLIQILPVIGSVVALILGYASRREIDNSGGMIEGRGLAQAGIVLGWIGVGFLAFGLCIIVLSFVGVLSIPVSLAFCDALGAGANW